MTDQHNPLPYPEQHQAVYGNLYTADQLREYGRARAARACTDLTRLIAAVHKAKGRYHSQLAMCDLYDACGLPNQRPEKLK